MANHTTNKAIEKYLNKDGKHDLNKSEQIRQTYKEKAILTKPPIITNYWEKAFQKQN